MQDTFGMNMVALVDGQPRVLNLKELLEAFPTRSGAVRRATATACRGAAGRNAAC